MSLERTRKVPLFYLYLLFGALIFGLLAWSSLRMLRETPKREVNLELPGSGWVTLSLTTDPFPPLPSGTVVLTFMGMNSRNVMVDLGASVPFSFGFKGSEASLGSTLATPAANGSGYQAGVQFPTPGDYWISFDLGNGQVAAFQLYVEPAQ